MTSTRHECHVMWPFLEIGTVTMGTDFVSETLLHLNHLTQLSSGENFVVFSRRGNFKTQMILTL